MTKLEDKFIIKIQQFKKQDLSKLAEFSAIGMNFDRYTNSRITRKIYSNYFVWDAYINATTAIAAYDGDVLCGVIMAKFDNEIMLDQNIVNKVYANSLQHIMGLLFEHTYNQVNQAMLDELKKTTKLDGEILLFAVNPDIENKGIGTKLLNELEHRYSGKNIYLFTDSNCSYQFYQHRNFHQVNAIKIQEPGRVDESKLTCFLFNKLL